MRYPSILAVALLAAGLTTASGASAVVRAQANPPAAAPDAVPSAPAAQAAAQQAAPRLAPAESVSALLRLDAAQIQRLNRAYEGFARARLEQEAQIALWQDEMRRVQSPMSFDEKRAARLVRDMTEAEKKIAEAFVRARAEALRTLTTEQRVLLERLSAEGRAVTEDRYRQLLLLGLDEIWKVSIDEETARALLDARAYAARSPRTYRYYNSPFGFSSYGYGLGSGFSLFSSRRNGYGIGARFSSGSGSGGVRDHHYDGPVHHDGHSSTPSHLGGSHHAGSSHHGSSSGHLGGHR